MSRQLLLSASLISNSLSMKNFPTEMRFNLQNLEDKTEAISSSSSSVSIGVGISPVDLFISIFFHFQALLAKTGFFFKI